MRMAGKESFADWFMKLEAQARLCEITEYQKAEELVQAMMRRLVPEIAGKLFEMDLLGNDLKNRKTKSEEEEGPSQSTILQKIANLTASGTTEEMRM